jgi:hypothetical protein
MSLVHINRTYVLSEGLQHKMTKLTVQLLRGRHGTSGRSVEQKGEM